MELSLDGVLDGKTTALPHISMSLSPQTNIFGKDIVCTHDDGIGNLVTIVL